MTRRTRSIGVVLVIVISVLLIAYGAFVALVVRHTARHYEEESLQRLSYGLAGHIAEHWPEVADHARDLADQRARDALLTMLMTVNPGIQVYLLDAGGHIEAYIGDQSLVREKQVELGPIRAFLSGQALPLFGTDPMDFGQHRVFSVAALPPEADAASAPGYLYVVLGGQAVERRIGAMSTRPAWLAAGLTGLVGMLIMALVGALFFRKLSRPLRHLSRRIAAYRLGREDGPTASRPWSPLDDEVQSIAVAFDDLTQRLEETRARETAQAKAHREEMAGVAHDLRTPLTALHGHLEALAGDAPAAGRARQLAAALDQSNKVRRLSQQLFELAALQSTEQVAHCERFCLDELVSDTVHKFSLSSRLPSVSLSGPAPGRVEIDGDVGLIERALTNLIDNALRHAPASQGVRVRLAANAGDAQIVVEDDGPGLPPELLRRLDCGQSLRDPPMARPGGGIGGLGLAIAQRIATLHGGWLRPVASTTGGAHLCLSIPVARD